jgi:osmotically-inducible protein OsmY
MTKLAALDPLEASSPGSLWGESEKRAHWTVEAPHRLEHAVKRHLLSHPELRFSTLVIRRIPNGVCLEGVLEHSANLDICDLARSIAGVNEVLNHLVVRQRCDSGRPRTA